MNYISQIYLVYIIIFQIKISRIRIYSTRYISFSFNKFTHHIYKYTSRIKRIIYFFIHFFINFSMDISSRICNWSNF